MKNKITQFARGSYEYKGPKLILSDNEISMDIEQGISYYGCFSISSEDHMQTKGLVYSSCRRLQILDVQFSGTENSVRYKVRTAGLQVRDKIEGVITCVTNRGEIEIPYRFCVIPPFCVSKDEPVKDLFQFTNLAKEDPLAAVSLFKSDAFKNVFLRKEAMYRSIYDALLLSNSASQAMEEFLIAIHKKSPVTISVDRAELSYTGIKESFMERIYISRSTWGYLEVKVSTDASFIQLDHKVLWTDNFVGSTYPLEIVMNPDKMRKGNNFGTIYLKTITQTLEIPVTCSCPHLEEGKTNDVTKVRRNQIELTKSYLNFRMHRLTLEAYIQETSDIVGKLAILEDDILYDLVRTHLYIISGNQEMSKEMIDNFSIKIAQNEQNALLYCALQYLKAMYDKDEQTIEEAISLIHDYFEKSNDFRILWFLLHLDKKYDKNKQLKLKDIRTVWENGCKSPIMYYEVCSLFNEDPTLLHELGTFEKQVINWGAKENYLSKELTLQVASLASREKKYTSVVYHMLASLYKVKPSKDLLFAICSILIKSEKTENKYFEWYRLGVEAQLKITSLHEFYMYAINEDELVSLSHPIYLYFIYNSSLSDNKKAFLYAKIIKEKKQNPGIYKSYEKQIEQFLIRQLQLRQVNRNLATIYSDFLPPDKINETVAADLSVLMFYHEISCDNPNIKGVSVVHKELEGEIYHPLKDGKTVVPIFTNHAQIFLVDNNDNRYYETVDYNVVRLMQYDRYVDACYLYEKTNSFLNMNLCEKYYNNRLNSNLSGLFKSVIQIPSLQEWFYKKCIFLLITNYYDYFDGDTVDFFVSQIDLKTLSETERAELTEFMILRGLYDKALDSLSKYGCNQIKEKNLVKLCMKKIPLIQGYDERLNYVAYQTILLGNIQEVILQYLLQNYTGTTREMYSLFLYANEKRISTAKYEELLLGQVLFSEMTDIDVSDVFLSYYNRPGEEKNTLLIDAYLGYFSYQYLLKDHLLSKEVVGVIKKEEKLRESLFYTLAVLKSYSKEEKLQAEDKEYIEFHITELIKKGIILPFYKQFKDIVALPEAVLDRHYVSYHTNKDKKVWIHYRIENENEDEDKKETFCTEPMKEVFCGIYVKEFILFCNEKLVYDITEEEEEAVQDSGSITVEQLSDDYEPKSEADFINAVISSTSLKDKQRVIDLVKQFVTLEHCIDELIKPL